MITPAFQNTVISYSFPVAALPNYPMPNNRLTLHPGSDWRPFRAIPRSMDISYVCFMTYDTSLCLYANINFLGCDLEFDISCLSSVGLLEVCRTGLRGVVLPACLRVGWAA
jgi:hypothetical protein